MTSSVALSAIEHKTSQRGLSTTLLRDWFDSKELSSPALLLSRGEIARNYQALGQALPRVGIHYAVKPNNHPVFIEEVYRCGGNFDICSAGEIDMVLPTGIDPRTLIHSHPIKSTREFDYAVGKGLEVFVIDNIEEVRKLTRYEKKLKILVRFRINTNTQAVVNLQYKFGCPVEDVLDLAHEIAKAGHEFYGLCFHIGSQCVYPENYVRIIEASHMLINQLDEAGFDTRLLDIGGGFPVEYATPVPGIEEFCAPIASALDEHIRPGIKIISEPGRFIAATPVTLVSSVIGKSYRDGKIWYYLDDGLYSTFSGIVFDHCQYPVVTNQTGTEKLSVLAGPTCDSFDVMYDGLMIPEHRIGDKMMFMSTGAYCSVSGTNFNALQRPDYFVVD